MYLLTEIFIQTKNLHLISFNCRAKEISGNNSMYRRYVFFAFLEYGFKA